MGSLLRVINTALHLGLLHLSVSFALLMTLGRSVNGYVFLDHLTLKDLSKVPDDVTFLEISDSTFEAIPKNQFDHLTHLNHLEITDSEIKQDLDPQTLSRLPGLEFVALRRVGLRRVNLNLTNVQALILAENELEAFDGRAVTGKNLNYLDLSRNKLEVLEGSFAHLSKLFTIDISRNRIRKVPPVFQHNDKLLRILAASNRISSTDGLKLPWLKTLDLSDNYIEELNSESFSKMAFLEELVLSNNNIHRIDDAFKDLVELKDINLSQNNIERLNGSLFKNNLYLTKLSLRGNKMRSVENFQNVLPHLTHLDLSKNSLFQIDDDFFHSMPSLQVLDLSFNRLGSLGNMFSPLGGLRILNLAFNYLQITGNELLANHELTRVNLSLSIVRGGVMNFRNSRHLRELDLSKNDISNFCNWSTVPKKSLMKLNLQLNEIESLDCLRDFEALCEVDLRDNPLTCGKELDDLILRFSKSRSAPYKYASGINRDLPSDMCEWLSLNRSVSLWNTVKHQLCPNSELVETEMVEEWESVEKRADEPEAESFEVKEVPIAPHEVNLPKKVYTHLPLGLIVNDEMNKPNPMQSPQSGRPSWGTFDENSELLNGFEDEEVEKRPRFSWYTIALILIGLSLTLTCFNLVVFLYIRLKVWKRAEATSSQKYTVLQNEVYKNTTEPSKVCPGEDFAVENGTRNKLFAYGKINEILLNFGLNKKDKDSESAKNILINTQRTEGV